MRPPVGLAVTTSTIHASSDRISRCINSTASVHQGVGVHLGGEQVPRLGEAFDRDRPFPVLRSVSQALRDGASTCRSWPNGSLLLRYSRSNSSHCWAGRTSG
jgi:hypothetical protein